MSDDPMQPGKQLTQDLGAIYHADVKIPANIEEAIQNRALAHLARPPVARGLVLRIGALVTAAAAVIVIAIYLAKPPAAMHQPQVAVDITDALRIERDIRDG